MESNIQKSIYIAGIIATIIGIFSFSTGISSIPSLFSSSKGVNVSDIKATKNLFYFYLDNFEPKVIDKFSSQILAKDRKGMLIVINELIESSKEIRRTDTAKEWKYLIKNNPDDITNSVVSRLISILAIERLKYRKVHNDYLAMITRALNRGLKKNNTKMSTGKMHNIDNEFLKSIGAPILDFPDMPQYYFCDDTFYSISKDRVFDRFYSSGLVNEDNGYLMDDGWDYKKTAKEVCSKYLLSKKI